MSDEIETADERPCLHCLLIEVIDGFYAENPISTEEPDAIDTNEVITAVAKTLAELTCGQDPAARQEMIDQFNREVLQYDDEYRQQDLMGGTGSAARH